MQAKGIDIDRHPDILFDTLKNLEVFKYLISTGIDPKKHQDELLKRFVYENGSNRYNSSSMKPTVEYLISLGENPAADNSKLLIAAIHNKELFDLLILHGADPKDRIGELFDEYVFYLAMHHTGVSEEQKEMLLSLLELGATVDSIDPEHLMQSVRNSELFDFLISLGVDPKPRINEFFDSYIESVSHSSPFDPERLNYFLSLGADPSSPKCKAIIQAVHNKKIFNFLVSHGADPSLHASLILAHIIDMNAHNQSELDKEWIEYVLSLFNEIPKVSSYYMGSACRNKELFDFLINHGIEYKSLMDDIFTEYLDENRSNLDLDRMKYLVSLGANPNSGNRRGLILAHRDNNKELVDFFLEFTEDDGILEIDDAIRAKDLTKLIELREKGYNIFSAEVLPFILTSHSKEIIQFTFDNYPPLNDALLIGLSNENGEWSPNVRGDFLGSKIDDRSDAHIIFLSHEIVDDESIMKRFSGLINPGAGDSYPQHRKDFTLNEMSEDSMQSDELLYLKVINVAKKLDIPYLGICAGAQKMVLNAGGSLRQVSGHQDEVSLYVNAGTVPHYMGLSNEEKSKALNQCEMEDYVIEEASVAHGYAGVEGNLGEGVVLSAKLDKNVTEAYSIGYNQIGVQFHPEDAYGGEGSEINRNRELLDTFFDMCESRYYALKYSKEKGLSQEEAVELLANVNNQILERITSCLNNPSERPKVHFWGRLGNADIISDQRDILILPDVLPNDIAYFRANEDLVFFVKDADGHLNVKSYFSEKGMHNHQRIRFADGSINEIFRNGTYPENTSYSLKSQKGHL